MAILDYFTVSPGDKKRAELELQNRLRLTKGISDIDTQRAINLRDSNQLSADFQRHQQERELQERLARMFPSNDPSLTADENKTKALIDAGSKLDEVLAAQPISSAATNMNTYEQATAGRPFNERLGESTATSAISGNEANTSGNFLRNKINKARFDTAPVAARQADVTQNAELINAYNEAGLRDRTLSGRENVLAAQRDKDIAESVNAAKEANARNLTLDDRTKATSALAGSERALADYNKAYHLDLEPSYASRLMNARNKADFAAEQALEQNPVLNKLMRIPAMNSMLMMNPELMQQITSALSGIGNAGGTGGGGLNAPVSGGARVPLNTKIQR